MHCDPELPQGCQIVLGQLLCESGIPSQISQYRIALRQIRIPLIDPKDFEKQYEGQVYRFIASIGVCCLSALP